MRQGKFGLLFVLLLCLFSSCGKDDEKVEPEDNLIDASAAPGQMTATINGVAWTSASAYAELRNKYEFQISGLDADKMIGITAVNIVKPGKFNAFSYQGLSGWLFENINTAPAAWTTLTSRKCELNITKLDWVGKKVSGTFAFVADSQAASVPTGLKNITNGTFTDLSINVGNPPNSVLDATVNNVAWSGSGMYISEMWGMFDLEVNDANGHSILIGGINSLQPGTRQAVSGMYIIPVNNTQQFWSADQNSPPTVTITQFDPVAKTASGSFSFNANPDISSGANGVKNISQGTFSNVPVF